MIRFSPIFVAAILLVACADAPEAADANMSRSPAVIVDSVGPDAGSGNAAVPAMAQASPASGRYACDDGSALDMRFETDGDAFLRLPGGDEARLPREATPSGYSFRSADYALSGKGDAFAFKTEGAPLLNCAAAIGD